MGDDQQAGNVRGATSTSRGKPARAQSYLDNLARGETASLRLAASDAPASALGSLPLACLDSSELFAPVGASLLLRFIVTAIFTRVVVIVLEVIFAGLAAPPHDHQVDLLAVIVHTFNLDFNAIA